MGKAAKWFRSLFGLKKSSPEPSSSPSLHGSKPSKEKRRWTFAKSQNHLHHQQHTITKEGVSASPYKNDAVSLSSTYAADPDKHAIAVAAATAAVAEAAVAAANAAAAVVRLTSSSGRCNSGDQVVRTTRGTYHHWTAASAALRIQSTFRGYLARRALLALKALVKLQALVRGYIVRKRNADLMRRMQAMLRAQAQACAGRVLHSESSQSSCKSSHYHNPGPATPEKFEHVVRSRSTRHEQSSVLGRNGSKSSSRRNVDQSQLGIYLSDPRLNEELWDHRGCPPSVRTGTMDDEMSDKILEIDTGKPHYSTKRRNLFQPSHRALSSDQQSHSFTTSKDSTTHHTVPSLSNLSSCEVQSLAALKFSHDVEEASFCTAENSPQCYSASSRGGNSKKGPFTPTKSDSSRSYLSGYSDHPNYMAFTESAKAKLRSLSAPKQRPHYERSGSTKRYSYHGFGDSRSSSSQRLSNVHASFTSKAYPGSGRLDRLGMPMKGDPFEATSGYRH